MFRVLARVIELETSRCATTNSTIIHLILVDEYAEFEVIFSSQYLRRIVAPVIPRDNLLHVDFNTILNHLQGNQYELFLKVGPWNQIGQYCELVLLKLFPSPD
ncbi:unnamed protein product [Linum trigynum]|uniref:Uncharacterized protein n=1 Tax=Linum trigynum TaxID=586398 RepID=A0AAV2CXT6_9ROSI